MAKYCEIPKSEYYIFSKILYTFHTYYYHWNPTFYAFFVPCAQTRLKQPPKYYHRITVFRDVVIWCSWDWFYSTLPSLQCHKTEVVPRLMLQRLQKTPPTHKVSECLWGGGNISQGCMTTVMLQLKLQKHQRYMCVLSPSYITQWGDLISRLCERLNAEFLYVYSSAKTHLFQLRKLALTSIEICTRRRLGTQMNRKNNQKVLKWVIIVNYLCSAQDIWHLIFYPAFYISSYCFFSSLPQTAKRRRGADQKLHEVTSPVT